VLKGHVAGSVPAPRRHGSGEVDGPHRCVIADPGHLLQVVKRSLKTLQYQPH
jgi:hypothetical protein